MSLGPKSNFIPVIYAGTKKKQYNKKNNTSIDFKVEKILKEETPGSYKLFGGGFLSPITHMRRYLTKKRLLNKDK